MIKKNYYNGFESDAFSAFLSPIKVYIIHITHSSHVVSLLLCVRSRDDGVLEREEQKDERITKFPRKWQSQARKENEIPNL